MKTVIYNNVLFRAAELAGRTRDKLLTSESTMLLGFIAAELNVLWHSVAWPELCDNIASYTPVNNSGVTTVTKNEGNPGEIGDVLGVWTDDPRVTTKARYVKFSEGNGQIYILEALATVWIDWQLPVTDLLAISDPNTLANTALPARFFLPLALKAAGWLLQSDGEVAAGSALKAAGEQELARQGADVQNPRWREVRVRGNC